MTAGPYYKPLNVSQVLLVSRVRSKLFGAATALRSLDRHIDLVTRARLTSKDTCTCCSVLHDLTY